MRLVTVIGFARSGGVSEKEKAREISCRDSESLFNPSFLTCFVSCVAIANSSFRCTLHLFFFRNLLSWFSHKGSQVLILLFLSSAP